MWPQAHLHTQWPGTGKPGDPVFDQFYASQVPSIASFPKQQELNRDALVALLDKIGPSILLTHSQSGAFGWPVADARPSLVKAIVAVEPSGPPVHDIENIGAPDWFKDARAHQGLRASRDVPLTYDPPVPPTSELDFARQDKAGRPDLVRCWLQKEPARKLPNLARIPIVIIVSEASYHAPYDHCTVGLSDAGRRAQHAHPPRRCRHPRQRPHDDDREEQCRHRGGHRAMADRRKLAVGHWRSRPAASPRPAKRGEGARASEAGEGPASRNFYPLAGLALCARAPSPAMRERGSPPTTTPAKCDSAPLRGGGSASGTRLGRYDPTAVRAADRLQRPGGLDRLRTDRPGRSRNCRRARSVPSRRAVDGQDPADVGRPQLRIALQHQRHDAADLGGGDRGAGGELIGVVRRRHQDVDAGRGDRDVACRDWRR